MVRARRASALALTLAVVLAPAAASAADDDPAGPEAIDSFVARTMDELPIPGMAVAVVRDGRTVHIRGYGTANLAGDPTTARTPFPVASITKSVTALAVRQLAADHDLDLDAPLRSVLPEFELADAAATAAVTIRHLLDHESGISTYEGTRPYLHAGDTTFEEALAHLARYRSARPPGTAYEYSNWNFVLLGEVVARISGRSYVEQVSRDILQPLGMRDASFEDPHTLPGAATGNLVVLGLRRPFDEPYVPVMESAGNLVASASDMARYLEELLAGGPTVLPTDGRGWFDTEWRWHAGLPNDVAVSSSGAHNAFNAAIQVLPAQGVGVAVLLNTRLDVLLPAPTADAISLEIGRLVAGQEHRLPTGSDLSAGYIALDVVLALVAGWVAWQALGLRRWARRFHRARPLRRAFLYLELLLSTALVAGVALLPGAFGTSWVVILDQRAVVALPILLVALGVAGVTAARVALLAWPARDGRRDAPPPTAGRADQPTRTSVRA